MANICKYVHRKFTKVSLPTLNCTKSLAIWHYKLWDFLINWTNCEEVELIPTFKGNNRYVVTKRNGQILTRFLRFKCFFLRQLDCHKWFYRLISLLAWPVPPSSKKVLRLMIASRGRNFDNIVRHVPFGLPGRQTEHHRLVINLTWEP